MHSATDPSFCCHEIQASAMAHSVQPLALEGGIEMQKKKTNKKKKISAWILAGSLSAAVGAFVPVAFAQAPAPAPAAGSASSASNPNVGGAGTNADGTAPAPNSGGPAAAS